MERYTRRILLGTALIAFIVIAPLVVLYAMGYRYGFDGGERDSVGVLLVDSIPKWADVYIEGELNGRTPQSIPNLTPGLINVRVEKKGYRTWQKNVHIRPGRATEVRSIRLFPDRLHVDEIVKDVQEFNLSPNRSLLAVLDSRKVLHVISDTGQQVVSGILLPEQPRQMQWSPDSSYILIEYPHSVYAVINVTRTDGGYQIIPELVNEELVVWDPRVPGRLFVLGSDLTISSFNLATRDRATLVEHVRIFAISARHIYAVNTNNVIGVYNLQGQFQRTIDVRLAKQVERLLVTPAGNIAIVFTDSSLVYLNEDEELVQVHKSVDLASWSPDGKMLLIKPVHNELYVYNAANERLAHIPLEELYLVVRFSRTISHPQWFAGGQHVLFQLDDEIVITEIDTRDMPASVTIDSTNTGDAQVTVGEDGEVIYYLKRNNGRSDLVATSLVADK